MPLSRSIGLASLILSWLAVITLLKPALQLMTSYRLVIQEVTGAEVLTSYTRWLESVQLRGGENQEVYVAFSPQFEHIWLNRRNVSWITWSRNRPILGSEASMAAAVQLGEKVRRVETKSISLEEFEKFSDWSRSKIRRKGHSRIVFADLGEPAPTST